MREQKHSSAKLNIHGRKIPLKGNTLISHQVKKRSAMFKILITQTLKKKNQML